MKVTDEENSMTKWQLLKHNFCVVWKTLIEEITTGSFISHKRSKFLGESIAFVSMSFVLLLVCSIFFGLIFSSWIPVYIFGIIWMFIGVSVMGNGLFGDMY